jgi:CheY-like chemotaxis protein
MAKILIVDDEPDAATSMARLLEQAGHRVTPVPNGRDALIQVMTAVPDVVLLDLMMPEMDGPSFLEVVRSYLRLQSLPVVVFTGLADSPMIERIRHLHVNAILVKGKASPEEILHALDAAVGSLPT